MFLQRKFVVSDLFREATAVCNANTNHWMSAVRGTKLLFAHEANRINTVGQSSPRDDNDAPLGAKGRIATAPTTISLQRGRRDNPGR
jgi:hypothetical protein